jgi:hypothetical protein
MFFGIQDDGKSPEKFCEFCTTYTIVRILSSLLVTIPAREYRLHIAQDTGIKKAV